MKTSYVYQLETSYIDALFQNLCQEANVKSAFKYSYPTNYFSEVIKIDAFELIKQEISAFTDYSFIQYAIYKYKETYISSTFRDMSAYLEIGSIDESVIKEIIEIVQKALPIKKHKQKDSYDMHFWYSSGSGPTDTPREFKEEPLANIIDNYSKEDQEKIKQLKDYKPIKGGELLLLTGEAGVGKSNLLLSLFREWKDWADFNYIMDQMNFFGQSPSYLLDLILKPSYRPVSAEELKTEDVLMASQRKGDYTKNDRAKQIEDKEKQDKWKVFILEDAGEMLSIDAKEKVGQSLSMFLNVTDGFVGRGSKIILILTTNEEISKLHPAVSRPGRCVFRHKFGRMSALEASSWAHKKECPTELTNAILESKKDFTLAELYALKNNKLTLEELSKTRNRVGFSSGD